MSRTAKLKAERNVLLRTLKQAFKFLRDSTPPSPEQEQMLGVLQNVIDEVDPPKFDESLTTVELVMTNDTASVIVKTLEERSVLSPEDARTFAAFQNGLRRTKQRAYCKLDLDFGVLRQLRWTLLHTKTVYQDKAFERLVKVLDEGLGRNPMQILGEMGL